MKSLIFPKVKLALENYFENHLEKFYLCLEWGAERETDFDGSLSDTGCDERNQLVVMVACA